MMRAAAILFLLAATAAANTNKIEQVYLEEEGLHCFDDRSYGLVLDKVDAGKAAAEDIKDLEEIVVMKNKLLKRYRVKSSLSVAGGIMAVAGSALLLSGNDNLETWGAAVAVGGLVSVGIGLAF